MKGNKLYAKAFEYHVRGWSVIPLRKNKRPLLGEGMNVVYQRERHASEEKIAEWWKNNPAANVGICTGKISGLTVIDIDRGALDGKETPLNTFPETYTVKTPTGGYQLYYQYCPNIQQTANTFSQFPHVDIRNDGGYVVAPPSHCDYIKYGKRTVGTYKIEKLAPIAPFPIHLFPTKAESISNSSHEKKVGSILKGFKAMAEGDGRNVQLSKVVGQLIRITKHDERDTVAWPAILAANAQFKEPLSEPEVRTIYNSINKRELKKPLATVDFLRDHKGNIFVNEENIYRTIVADENLNNHFRHNTFNGALETNFENADDYWEPLQRVHVTCVCAYLQRTYEHLVKVSHGTVEDALLRYMKEHRVSPPLEWLRSLKWDSTPRLDLWLGSVYGVETNDYHRAVASNWMKGLVKRIVEPGCKFDYVLVLEGPQGTKKSTSLATLGAGLHVETVFTPDNKDFFMAFAGKAIVEFSEGETLSRTEVKKLKAVITMQYDKYRPPYERSPKEFPRQCVFAMTTNQDQYLKDETGNRRWLPVACKKTADIEYLEQYREQLFAEAYHRVITLKETTWEFPEEETLKQQAMREIDDPRAEQIFDWFFNVIPPYKREEGITTRMAFLEAIHANFPTGKEMTKFDEMIIANILRKVLCLEKRRTSLSGERFYRYYPTEKTHAMQPQTSLNIDAQRSPLEKEFNDFKA